MNIPVDIKIYVSSLVNDITNGDDYFEFLYEFDVQDSNKFKTLFADNVTSMALDNFEKFGEPQLNYEQFHECMEYAVADYHLECLQEKGMIESYVDESTMELLYKATDKALMQTLLHNICLN